MAELKLRDGDYVCDGAGGLVRAEGGEALLQRALFRLTARRGQFPLLPELGSRLWQLGSVPAGQRQARALEYAAEALAEETGLRVERVTLTPKSGGATGVTAELAWEEGTFDVELTVQ